MCIRDRCILCSCIPESVIEGVGDVTDTLGLLMPSSFEKKPGSASSSSSSNPVGDNDGDLPDSNIAANSIGGWFLMELITVDQRETRKKTIV